MPTRSLSLTAIRPDDLLVLRLDFIDVDFTPPAGGQPGLIGGQAQARLIVHFQPQHVAEQAFWEVSDGTKLPPGVPAEPPGNDPLAPPGKVDSRLSGPTRLGFTIPAGQSFPLTLEGVLNALKALPLAVSGVAGYEPASGCLAPFLRLLFPPPHIAQPNRDETAIEAPYRLFLSPDGQATWDHARTPVKHDGRIELWHTRLGSRRASKDPRVRAVWSPDFVRNPQGHANAPFVPFRTSLDGQDRNELVQLTSNYYIPDFTPTPVETRRLMLTTLGAWLDLDGDWVPPAIPADPPDVPENTSLSVEQWRHVATMGRDHFVRVVYAGYLLGIGHRASLVKITERKFFYQKDAPVPGFVAYDYQRMFILRRELERTYEDRDFPFRKVIVKTPVTPNLAKPEDSQVLPASGQDAFWPRVLAGGTIVDFPFHLVGVDWEGREIDLHAPLIFVSKTFEANLTSIHAVTDAYNALPLTGSRRECALGGQKVAFAPAIKSGDTTLEAQSITLGVAKVDGTPHFRPTMAQASVDIPPVKQLLGKAAVSTIQWEPTFLAGAGQAIGNAGQVFAQVTNKPPLEFGADKSGGLTAPNIGITGLSRSLGPVGGPVSQMVTGSFDPKQIFGDVKLMGGIKLSAIIRVLNFDNAASAGGKLPQFLTVREGDVIRTRYVWSLSQAELQGTDLFVPKGGSELTLEAVVEKRVAVTTPPVFRTTGRITNFTVALLPPIPTNPGDPPNPLHLVDIDFKSISFVAEAGKKVDTAVELDGIKFAGILEFVNELQKVIPSDGFKDPPSLELVPPPDTGVNVGFTLGIPSIGIGVMTMQNVSLSAGFYLPFVEKPPMSFRFAFCTRSQPFILTVSLFGGGGFFAIQIGLTGVTSIEAALEFGASVAINLGVASGQATIMAGFYFHMTDKGFELTGYLRACASLSVLGIITVTVEFYLGLSYASKGIVPHGGHLWGQARVTVKIEILFFSTSVGVTLEREFAGSDPSFKQLMAPGDWGAYCAAFDDYPAVVGE